MGDGIYKNGGRISTKCPPTEFFVRSTIFNIANPRWRLKLTKIIVKSLKNLRPRVFGVADYEFIVINTKFNMADSRWWMIFWKNIVKSD